MRVKPVGTGPFVLDTFDKFERIRLKRNPATGRPAGRFSTASNSRWWRAGPPRCWLRCRPLRHDLSGRRLDDAVARRQRRSSHAVCETAAANNNNQLMLNRSTAPFDNPDIRRALMLALDRREFVDTLDGGGAGTVGGHLQPPPEGRWGLTARC